MTAEEWAEIEAYIAAYPQREDVSLTIGEGGAIRFIHRGENTLSMTMHPAAFLEIISEIECEEDEVFVDILKHTPKP